MLNLVKPEHGKKSGVEMLFQHAQNGQQYTRKELQYVSYKYTITVCNLCAVLTESDAKNL